MITKFKIFEKIDLSPYKRFLVLNDKLYTNEYYIDEVIGLNDRDSITVVNIYYINIKNDSEIKKGANEFDVTERYLDSVIYTSNSLEECYEYLSSIVDSVKYNL